MSGRFRQMSGLLATLAVVVFLGACGREDDSSSAAAPGISDETIKIGASFPFSGPVSALSAIADGATAYFEFVNSNGGVDGREIEYVTLDDGYEPQTTLQNARKLVLQEDVFAVFGVAGTPTNLAIYEYLNEQEVPHLYVSSGSATWGADTEGHPWTIGWQPDYVVQGRALAEYLKESNPDASVGVLAQNDDFGEDFTAGFKVGIEGSEIEIVSETTYESSADTIDTQVSELARSGADTFLSVTTPRFTALGISRSADIGWDAEILTDSGSATTSGVFEPAGIRASTGTVVPNYLKSPEDPRWDQDDAMVEYKDGLAEFAPDANANDILTVYGWASAQTMVQTLENTEELSRESLMETARNLDLEVPMLLPGITVETGPDDPYPIESIQIEQFDGDGFTPIGDVLELGEIDR